MIYYEKNRGYHEIYKQKKFVNNLFNSVIFLNLILFYIKLIIFKRF